MNLFGRYAKRIGLLMAVLFIAGLAVSQQAHAGKTAQSYSFTVHNKSGQAIKGLLASEDGTTYGHFDIGSGIAAGQTAKLVWSKGTSGQSCTQYFKAVFADGNESAAGKFDFCEDNVELEFED